MSVFRGRAIARRTWSLWSAAALVAGSAWASPDPDAPLTLAEAERLALARQPQVAAQQAAVEAARHEADAAGALPDPMLSAGVLDLPVQGADRYSNRDDFTMYTVGIEQDLALGGKRALREQKARLAADHQEHLLDIARRTVARESRLAWLDRWQAERERTLAEQAVREAEASAQAAEIAYRTGRGSQADLLAANVALEMLQDEATAQGAAVERSRPMLERWIGEADAVRPTAESAPESTPAPLDAALGALAGHPDLASTLLEQRMADTEVALAESEYRPDWSVGLEYGYRPLFADYVSLNVRVGLPVFPAYRQGARLAAAQAQVVNARESAEDARRRFVAEIRAGYAEWSGLHQRLARYDAEILKQAGAGVAAAQAAYASGSGTLTALLNARQSSLAAQRARIRLAADQERAAARLAYYAPESHP